jgi:hypothetical protein
VDRFNLSLNKDRQAIARIPLVEKDHASRVFAEVQRLAQGMDFFCRQLAKNGELVDKIFDVT